MFGRWVVVLVVVFVFFLFDLGFMMACGDGGWVVLGCDFGGWL